MFSTIYLPMVKNLRRQSECGLTFKRIIKKQGIFRF